MIYRPHSGVIEFDRGEDRHTAERVEAHRRRDHLLVLPGSETGRAERRDDAVESCSDDYDIEWRRRR